MKNSFENELHNEFLSFTSNTKSFHKVSDDLDPEALAVETTEKQGEVLDDISKIAGDILHQDLDKVAENPNATQDFIENLKFIVMGVENVEAAKRLDEDEDHTVHQLQKSMLGRMGVRFDSFSFPNLSFYRRKTWKRKK